MRDKLRKWREDNCRNSEQIVDVGEELISDHGSKLGDDGKSFLSLTIHALAQLDRIIPFNLNTWLLHVQYFSLLIINAGHTVCVPLTTHLHILLKYVSHN